MSFWDWVNVGKVDATDKSFDNYKGSFGVTTGTTVGGYYGSRHTHIFGSEIKIICDPEDVLAGKLGAIAPLVSALISGIGGNTTYTYGTATGLTAFGPKADILRGKAIKRTSDTLFGTFTEAKASNHNKLDAAIKVAVAALTLLLFAVAAGMELYIRVHYEEFNPKSNKDCNRTTEMLATLDYTLTSRIMALIRLLEVNSTWGELAEACGKEVKTIGAILASPFVVAVGACAIGVTVGLCVAAAGIVVASLPVLAVSAGVRGISNAINAAE